MSEPEARNDGNLVPAGRAVLTFNRRHLVRLHLFGAPHAGVISCTRDDHSACDAGVPVM
jgi:hypothetical protein